MRKVLFFVVGLMSFPAMADPQSALMAVRAVPGVVNAFEDRGGNLWVLVNNTQGARWNPAAANICKLVRQYEARIFMVKLIDAATFNPKNKPKDWTMLGAVNCGMIP